MNTRIQIIAACISLGITAFIFELIRKRKMLEKYSLLWFGAALVLIVLSIWRNLLEKTAALIGVFYAPSALFIIAAFFAVLMFLHFTIVISKLTEQNKMLAQEVGILREELQQMHQMPNRTA
jgi:hypothetical protein